VTDERNKRKRFEGWVIGAKMDKTRVVHVLRRFRTPIYEKVITRYTKLYAHDENNSSQVGDQISIEETRPLSKLKRWRVVEILKKGALSKVGKDYPAERSKKEQEEPKKTEAGAEK
jgi:small subunit ribosomal protein S17